MSRLALSKRLIAHLTPGLPGLPCKNLSDSADSADRVAYQIWQRQFLQQRLRLGLRLAIVAYLTFILLRLVWGVQHATAWDRSWLLMAICAETGLLLCLLGCRLRIGQQRPDLLFLGAAWSVTIVEQIWATGRGIAFAGLYAWTLTFLTLATLIPVRWRLHLVAQLGVLSYYYGVNGVLSLRPADQPFWDARQMLYLFWFCCICDLSVYLYERLQRSEFYAQRQLQREQEKSEKLLLNILPEPVAQQLKQEQRTIAESFAEVTVLFADIVGFTQLSSSIPPDQLVTLLSQIFSTFDRLAERHGLEKIKTIGDAYMAVGGLPLERAGHAEAVADLALDMQAAIAQFSQDQQRSFSIRIGINLGPVVAGVIGTKRFIYDLWGDTVNVASRMESQGLAGRIQVTAAVYERLRSRYVLVERGAMDIKGKGPMTTYLLLGRQTNPQEQPASSQHQKA